MGSLLSCNSGSLSSRLDLAKLGVRYVFSGVCWLSHAGPPFPHIQKDKQIKAWNKKHTKRKKISRHVFTATWIFILIQGVLEIPEHGAWVPFSLWGYGATQTFSFGLINGFRNLLISSPNYLGNPKDISLNIFGCLIFLFLYNTYKFERLLRRFIFLFIVIKNYASW